DIETAEKRRLCPNYKRENLRQLQYCEPARKRVRCGLSIEDRCAANLLPSASDRVRIANEADNLFVDSQKLPRTPWPKEIPSSQPQRMLFVPHLENGVLLRGRGHTSYSATFLALHLPDLFPCIGVETHPLVSVKGFFCSVAPRRATLGNR